MFRSASSANRASRGIVRRSFLSPMGPAAKIRASISFGSPRMIGSNPMWPVPSLLEIRPRGDLGEYQAVGGELEAHGCGHLQRRFASGGRVLAAEGPLLDISEKLGHHNTVGDDRAILHPAAARHDEGPGEHQPLGVLADVDEPPPSPPASPPNRLTLTLPRRSA